MSKCITQLIPENVAPKGATGIGVYNSKGSKAGYIPFGRASRPTDESDYLLCVLSDAHVEEGKYPTATEDFQRALQYANTNCAFTCIAGDLVDSGGVESQLANYANLVKQYSPNKPVYAIAGNHENYNGYADGTNGYHLKDYTGYPLYYSFGVDNKGQRVAMDDTQTPLEYADTVRDVFIMVGHFGAWHDTKWWSDEFVSLDELQWLYDTLEANRNKRCFVFNHVLPVAHGVGDPCDLYTILNATVSSLWNVNDGGIGQAYISLLRHYKNTILFHGHSHTRFDLQELDPKANYSNADGYRSVHIPSLAVPRDDVSGALKDEPLESEGYIVEVYPDYIVLNGRDFVGGDEDGHWSALGTYKIDTTLQTVEEGTFIDPTGLIAT